MTSSRKQKLSPQFSPQSSPIMAKKFSVMIRNNCVWHTMQVNNFPKEQISNMRSIISFMTWYELSHFRESRPLLVQGKPCLPIEISSEGTLGAGRGYTNHVDLVVT
jgi:hypothetical protein